MGDQQVFVFCVLRLHAPQSSLYLSRRDLEGVVFCFKATRVKSGCEEVLCCPLFRGTIVGYASSPLQPHVGFGEM